MASTSKDLGIATAYGYAKSKGYLGTEEEFAQLMADYATVGQQAAESASEAATKARVASNHATEAAGQATVARREAEAAASSASTASSMKDQAAQEAYLAASARYAAQEAASSVRASAEQIAQNTSDIAALGSAKATAIINTASGAIASFADGADGMPVKKLVVNVEPKQKGSGDPSPENIRPISGWTGAEIVGAGKNLLKRTNDYQSTMFRINDDNSVVYIGGAQSVGQVAQITNLNLQVKEALKLTGSPAKKGMSIRAFYGNNTVYYEDTGNGVVIPANTTIIRVAIIVQVAAMASATENDVFYPMLRPASDTDDTYEPFQSKEISVTFPASAGTVYGSTLTIKPDRTGTLVVDRAAVDMGTLTWAKRSTEDASAMVYRANISGRKFGTDSEGIRGQCSQYSFRNNSSLDSLTNNMQNGYFGFQATVTGVVVRDDRYTTAEDFATAVSGVMLVYPLANPITYQLTSEQISGILTTLYGTNNIWADCGDTSVTYVADTKLYIEHLTQPTEDDMTANANIAINKFFMLGNTLYFSTAAIAQGETIVPGTNCNLVSLADALNQLNT